jgi:hypothetical protein
LLLLLKELLLLLLPLHYQLVLLQVWQLQPGRHHPGGNCADFVSLNRLQCLNGIYNANW